MTDLFIGVVSHARSRFADSQHEHGLGARLRDAFAQMGRSIELVVNTDDFHDPQTLPITRAVEQHSYDAELRLTAQWARFLGQPRDGRWWAVYGARWMRRVPRWLRRDERAITRLVNIELSHLDLMRRGLAAGAPWVLVLEDDAASEDVVDCARGLAGLMDTALDRAVPTAYVNVSQSFPLADLGIDHLLQPAPDAAWVGDVPRQVLAAAKPVTNTVCAILYEVGFLRRLVDAMDQLPMTPVVPIDWKLNQALMALHGIGALPPGSCLLVEPAPITQRSGVPQVWG